MTTDRALIALIAGTPLVALSVLAPVSAALGLAGAAICLVALRTLTRASENFGTARLGAVLGLVGSALLLADLQVRIADWLVLLGLLLVLTGGCAGMRELVPQGFRREAAGRISGSVLTVMLTLGVFIALDDAGAGPGWVTDATPVLRGITGVLVAWFVAYVAMARTVVPARVS
jgi:hypothetical protein